MSTYQCKIPAIYLYKRQGWDNIDGVERNLHVWYKFQPTVAANTHHSRWVSCYLQFSCTLRSSSQCYRLGSSLSLQHHSRSPRLKLSSFCYQHLENNDFVIVCHSTLCTINLAMTKCKFLTITKMCSFYSNDSKFSTTCNIPCLQLWVQKAWGFPNPRWLHTHLLPPSRNLKMYKIPYKLLILQMYARKTINK